jgi:hypothetical protein
MLAWIKLLGRDQVVAADGEEVVVEPGLAFPQEQREPSRIAAEREQNPFGAFQASKSWRQSAFDVRLASALPS